MKNKLLIIDDEPLIRMSLNEGLKDATLDVITAKTGREAIELIKNDTFDFIITDIKLPDINGLEILKFVKDVSPKTSVIIMTAYGTSENAVDAIKMGAFDYITKPFSIEEIKIILSRAEKLVMLEEENTILKERLNIQPNLEIVGISKPMIEIKNSILTIANSDSPVLITGETGTGKELIADAIHYSSKRKSFPYIKINCAAIPETLLESELFGFEKGAFTGAFQQRKGKIELANHGTLFLDEIGDMPTSLQAKLLRVLQFKEIERLGGSKNIKVDIRIIVATKKNLKEEIRKGNFREDLFYRINVFHIHLPPLKERKEDIPLLTNYFLKMHSLKSNKNIEKISDDAMEAIKNYDFPGNVRELNNIIERAVMLCSDSKIDKSLLPIDLIKLPENVSCESTLNLKRAIEECEKSTIMRALNEARWRKTDAAEILGISRKALWEKIRKYNIKIQNDQN